MNMWYMPIIIGTYLGIPFIAKLVKEFLVKDYTIYKNAEQEEIIKNTWMSDCIKTYIDNEEIRILTEKSEWIGNDVAHYIRKQEGREINDMKRFIDAMTYFISMSLIVDDASTMQSKNIK